ncbi:MAG: ABC transporter substrate-binding protein [Armatimonadota bacterium]|nr:ABC transporter substrate-binding protein [Armatimonadota bacterium]MDR7535715.1 ABC transporter substrate-binding protein [Armatimonadota bacterium]
MRRHLVRRWAMGLLVVAVLAGAVAPGLAQAARPEKPRFVMAIGGKEALVYLPLTVAERLGYFKDAGLDPDLQNFAGGGQALRALIGGSADAVSGFYDHTIQMQAQGRKIRAVVMQQRYPGLVLAIAKHAADAGVRDLAALRGKKIGVTAPGSSTHFFVNYLMAKVGVGLDEFSIVGVGPGATAVAAVRARQIDAISNVDPTITTLSASGDLPVILADTRTTTGTLRVFGGPYPAACIYVREEFLQQHPNTVQAIVTAMVRALRWIKAHKVEEIVALMPPEYYQGNRDLYTQAVRAMLESYSLDGRISPAGASNVLGVLGTFDAAVRRATINVAETYEMRFVDAYWKAPK